MNERNTHIFSKNTIIHTWPNETESFVLAQWTIWWLIMMLCLRTNHHPRKLETSIYFDHQVRHFKQEYPCLVTICTINLTFQAMFPTVAREKPSWNSLRHLYIWDPMFIFYFLCWSMWYLWCWWFHAILY